MPARSSFEELQYLAASYRQVLNSEGLIGFVNASYGWGRPGTAALQLLEYTTRSSRRRGRPDLSGDPLARDESDADRRSAS